MSAGWLAEFVLLAALWGASFLFMRLGAAEFGPLATAGLRVILATLFLWPIMLGRGQWPALRQRWRAILLIGVVNSALPFALYAWAVLSINTGLAAILNATTPLCGAAGLAVAGRAPGRLKALGLAIGFAGVVLLAIDRASFKPGGSGFAVLACLAATLCYGWAANLTRRYLGGRRRWPTPPAASSARRSRWRCPPRCPGRPRPQPGGLGLDRRDRGVLHRHRLHPVFPPDPACGPGARAHRHLRHAAVRGRLWQPVPARADHAMDAGLRPGHHLQDRTVHRIDSNQALKPIPLPSVSQVAPPPLYTNATAAERPASRLAPPRPFPRGLPHRVSAATPGVMTRTRCRLDRFSA
jgi:hypothetical protein